MRLPLYTRRPFLLLKITNNPILWFDIEKGGSCKIEHLNELKLIIMINGYGYNKLHEAMFLTQKMSVFCPKIDPLVEFSREKTLHRIEIHQLTPMAISTGPSSEILYR